MAVTLIGSGGYFTRHGKAVKALNALNTFRGTTNVANLLAVLVALEANSPSLAVEGTGAGISAAGTAFIAGGNGCVSELQKYVQNLLIQMVYEDNPQPSNDLTSSLIELIKQIKNTNRS